MSPAHDGRLPVRTKHADILAYWVEQIEWDDFEMTRAEWVLGIEVDPEHPRCFACGRVRNAWARFDRSHLIADCEGGTDCPENLVLLCDVCNQREMPTFSSRVLAAYWVFRQWSWKVQMRPASPFSPVCMRVWCQNYAEIEQVDESAVLTEVAGHFLEAVRQTPGPQDDEMREYQASLERLTA